MILSSFVKHIFGLMLLFSLLLLPQPVKSAEDDKKLEVIQKELKESREKLQETKVKEQEVLGKLVVITKDLKKAQQNLNKAERKITVNENQIYVLGRELNQTADDLKGKERELSSRVREAYKSSGINHLELLFASQSMSDFMNRFYYLGKILSHDASLVKETRVKLQTTREKREVLKVRTEEIKDLAEEIKEEKDKIKEKEEEEKTALQELKKREEEYESKIAELEKSNRQMEALIRQKEAQRQRAGIASRGSGTFVWPLKGRLTSRFGYRRHRYWGGRHMHTGLDIAAPHGSPVGAADSGEVIFSGWWDGYGKAIVIDHGRGISTVYAHLSRLYAQVGAAIAKSQTIGLVGSTGYSTGPHLHFEVRRKGTPVNPMAYLR